LRRRCGNVRGPSVPVAFYYDPGEVPTPRPVSDRDGDLPALRLEVLLQGCRQRRGHVPGEHLIVLLRGERNEFIERMPLFHLQHVGTMGDALEATPRRDSRPPSLGQDHSTLRLRRRAAPAANARELMRDGLVDVSSTTARSGWFHEGHLFDSSRLNRLSAGRLG
jgi:hypothetical protein